MTPTFAVLQGASVEKVQIRADSAPPALNRVNQAITGNNSMVLVNNRVDSNEEKGCKTEKIIENFNSKTKKAGHSQMKGTDEIDMISGTTTTDKTYKISRKR